MDVQRRRHCLLDGVEKLAELHAAVPAMAGADHRSSLHIERGKQGRRAVALVIVTAALGLSGPHRQQRLRPIQRLNLRFLIDAQHQCAVRRIHVQSNDVANLINEQRIFGKFERLAAMRLQGERSPDATDGASAESALLRQRTRTPMRGVARQRFQSHGQHSLHLRVADLARCPRTSLIEQSIEALLQKRARHFPTICLVTRN